MSNDNFTNYYDHYTSLVEESDYVKALKNGLKNTLRLLEEIPEELQEYRYDEGKWTPKEMLVHMIDSERVFAYRAMRFARFDKTPLPGFEHNDYIEPSRANERSWKSIMKEYRRIRKSTITLFENFPSDSIENVGNSNGANFKVSQLAFIICGHEKHHYYVLRERYLTALKKAKKAPMSRGFKVN